MSKFLKGLSLVLVLILLVGVIAACDCNGGNDNSSEAPADNSGETSDVQGTGLFDNYLLEIDGTTVSKDFTLPSQVAGKDVEWSSDNEAITIEKRAEDYLATINFPDSTQEVTLTVKCGGDVKTFVIRVNALDVYTFLDNYAFPQDKQTVVDNFDLDQSFTYKDRTASIAWSVDESYADYLAVSEDGKTALVYGSSLDPTVKIKATFTYNGESATKTYRLTVSLPMSELEKIDNWYNSTGLTQTLSGYVVAKGPWTNYNGTYEAILYIIDDSLQCGYYLYNEPTDMDEDTYAALKPGMHVTCTNPVNSNYNGLMETSNYKGKTTLDSDVEPIDITPYALDNDLIGGVPGLRYRQSTLVSLTDWKVTSVNSTLAEKSPTTLLKLEKNGVSIAVQITKYFYDYAHDANDEIVKAILAKVATVKEGDWISVEGVLGWYNAPQISLLSADGIKAGKKDDSKSCAGTKVAALIAENQKLLEAAGADKLICSNKTFDLKDKNADGDVTVKFELCSNSAAVALDGGHFAVTPGKQEKVHVQATYTCGDYSTVTFFYLESVAKSAKEMVEEEINAYTIGDQNAGVVELRNVPLTYDAVKFTFSVEDAASKKLVSIKKSSMTLQPVEKQTPVTIRVTAICDSEMATKDITFNILVSEFVAYDVVTDPKTETEYKLGFDNGIVMLANGQMSGYYGAVTTDPAEAVSAYVEKNGKKFNVYVIADGAKKYVNMTISGDHVNYTYDDTANTAWVIDSKGCFLTEDDAGVQVWAGTRGTYTTIAVYRDTTAQVTAADSYPLHLFTMTVDKATPADRAKAEAELISIPSSVTENLELPTEYKKYYDVTISWAMKEAVDGQAIKNNVLTITRGTSDVDVVLVATAKCGTAKKSKEFTVKVCAIATLKTVSEIYDLGIVLDDKQTSDAEYECIGIVESIASEYSEEYKNVSVWMTDGDDEKKIEAYRIKGDYAADLKPGDVITVSGKIQNYGGTVEFVSGSIIKEYVAATFKTVTELYNDGQSDKQDKTTVFSTYGKIDEIVNPISGDYKTCNVYITDGTSRIEAYKLGGDLDTLKNLAVGDVIAVYGKMTKYKDIVEFDGCTLVSVSSPVEKSDADKLQEELGWYKMDDVNAGLTELNTTPKKYEDVKFSFSVEDSASKKLMSIDNGTRIKCLTVAEDTEVTLKVTATLGKETASKDLKFKILVTEFVKYSIAENPEAGKEYKLGFDNGSKVLFATGVLSGYYGATSNKSDDGAPAYVEKVNGGINVYVMVDGAKKYVNLTVSGTHYNYTYDDTANTVWPADGSFVTTADDATVWMGSRGTYGTIGGYAESAQTMTAADSYPLHLYEVVKDNATPAERAQAELDLIDLPASTTEDIEVSDIYQKYFDVELAWTMKEAVAGQTFADNKLTITRGDADVNVVLVCTATCGTEVKTKEFPIVVEANATVMTVGQLYVAGNAAEDNAFLPGQYECTGIVESIAGAYNETNKNISIWMIDGSPNRKIEAFRLSGDGVADLKAGDVVTVVGKVKKYVSKSGAVTVEFDAGCTLKNKVDATLKTVTELYEDGKSGSQDKTTVFSTYGKVNKIQNPISGTYTTCNIWITDLDNSIEAYKLTGDLETLKAIKVGDYLSCYGKMTTYGDTVEFDGCTLVTLTGDYVMSDKEIAEEEAKAYKLDDVHAGANELPTAPAFTEGVTFTFAVEDEESKKLASIGEDGKLVCLPVDDPTPITLKVTATYKGESATDDVTTNILPSSFTKFNAVTELIANQAYKIGFDNGTVMMATGEMSTYYGATSKNAADAVDAFVEIVEGGYNLYIVKADKTKKYVNMTASGTYVNFTYDDDASTVWTYDDGYFKMKTAEDEIVWIGTRSTYTTIGAYKESAYKAASSYPLKAYEVVEDNSNTEERALAELNAITLPESVTADLALPTDYQTYYDVTLAWALKEAVDGQTLEENTLKITRGETNVSVVLTATATCGLTEKTKDFTVVVEANAQVKAVSELYDLGVALANGEFIPGQIESTGVVTKIQTAFKNGVISLWMADGVEGKEIEAYKLAGDGCENIKVGDIITVVGKVKNFTNKNGTTIEFDSGCTLKSRIDTTFKTVTELYEDGMGGSQDTTTVFCTYGTIDEVVNGIYGTYTTVNVFITDGTNRIEAYKMGGDLETLKLLQPGDTIICYGKMTVFSTTVEFNGCTLAARTAANDAAKAWAEASCYALADSDFGDVNLTTAAQYYEGTTFTFAAAEGFESLVSFDGAKMTLAAVAAETPVKVNVTAAYNGKQCTAEKSFKILVPATTATVNEIYELGNALADGAFLDGQYKCTAYVSSIASKYNSSKKTISVWLEDGSGNKIEAFGMKGEGIDTLKVGDVITVQGKVQKYVNKGNVTIEFTSSPVMTFMQPATYMNVADLKAKCIEQGETASTEYYVTYGKVKSIATAYSSKNHNISLNIFTEDKSGFIQMYRLTGDDDVLSGIQVGDTVCAYGQIKYYAKSSLSEFNGCALIGVTKVS